MITDQKTIDALKELNYSQVYEKGKEDARQEILEKIDSFINYANQEKKDNYLWYKIQLENLKQQLNQPKTEE